MKKNFKNIFGWCFVAAIGLISSCTNNDSTAPTPSLYSRLGGVTAISAVTDQFLANVAADSRINARFSATVADEYRLQLLRDNLIDQICSASGGPCAYKGKTMLQAHTGMNITADEFTALVEDLVASLTTFKVADKEKNDLLAVLGPLQSDIVGK